MARARPGGASGKGSRRGQLRARSVVPQVLSLALGRTIDVELSILFLDEIQAAEEVIGGLRWFYEELPTLPVIAGRCSCVAWRRGRPIVRRAERRQNKPHLPGNRRSSRRRRAHIQRCLATPMAPRQLAAPDRESAASRRPHATRRPPHSAGSPPARFGVSGSTVCAGGFGAMRDLHGLADASTPAYLTVWNRGGGTLVARRHSSDSGSMFDRDGSVGVCLLQGDAHQSVGAALEALLCNRRPCRSRRRRRTPPTPRPHARRDRSRRPAQRPRR